MGLRRRLLSLVSLTSLAVLMYGGVSFGFSVPVTQETAEANVAPLGGMPEGARAIVIPIADAGLVPTLHSGGEAFLGYPGAMVAHGTPGRYFPAAADDVQIGRVLLHLGFNETPPARDASLDADNATRSNATRGNATNGSVDGNESAWLVHLTGVPMPHALGENGTDNLTLDIGALYDGRAGFVVKADHESNATFVPLESVVGEVSRFDSAARTRSILIGGATGFLAPLILLGTMRRELTREDGAEGDACRECRSAIEPMHSFCLRCGAWKEETPA